MIHFKRILLLCLFCLFPLVSFQCFNGSTSSDGSDPESGAMEQLSDSRSIIDDKEAVQKSSIGTISLCKKWIWAATHQQANLSKPQYQQDFYKEWYFATPGYWKAHYWYSWTQYVWIGNWWNGHWEARNHDVYWYEWIAPTNWTYRLKPYPWKTLTGYEMSPVYGWEYKGLTSADINDPVQEWKSRDSDNPVLSLAFNSGNKIKWYWGGCTTLIGVLEDGPIKEILLVDGYVSKEAFGISDFTLSPLGIGRVKQYSKFISSLLAKGFTIKGLLVSHAHADHVGDVPFLIYFLKEMNPGMKAFPIITDYFTYKDANKPIISEDIISLFHPGFKDEFKQFNELVTNVIVYNWSVIHPASLISDLITANENFFAIRRDNHPISSYGKPYSQTYSVYDMATRNYNKALVDSDHLQLGNFSIAIRLMDHANVPGVDERYRVNCFQVWNKDIGDRGKVLILDSTDNASFVPKGVIINTDHIFLTWAPYFFTGLLDSLMGYNREKTAITVRDHVRFYSGTSDIHFVVPMHVDDIMAVTYGTTPICDVNTFYTFSGYLKPTGFTTPIVLPSYKAISYFLPSHQFSMPNIMMSTREYLKGPYMSTYSEILPLDKTLITTPHVDVLRWSGYKEFYYYAPQISEPEKPKIAFAIFGNRAGLEY